MKQRLELELPEWAETVTVTVGVAAVTDHDLLLNLDYASAGHIGFQPTVTGGATTIVAANLAVNMALVSNVAGKVVVSGVTEAELSQLENINATTISIAQWAFLGSAVPADIVTATANITDHSLVRGHGGARIVQDSNVLLDDLDNLSGIVQILATTFSDGTAALTGGVLTGDVTGDVTGNVLGDVTGNVTGSSGSCTGIAATADQWTTTRTITLSGEVTADAVNIDGTGNIDITTVVVTNNVTATANLNDHAVIRGDGGANKVVQHSGVVIDDLDNITGVTQITATTFTDGTATLTGGALTGVTITLGGDLDPNGHEVSDHWIPATDSSYNIGSAAKHWYIGYFDFLGAESIGPIDNSYFVINSNLEIGGYITDRSLVGWWQFANSAKDSMMISGDGSALAHDGTLTNGATATNGVLELDGLMQYVDLGSVTSTQLLSLAGVPFTLMAWIKPALIGNDQHHIIDKSTATDGTDGYILRVRNNGNLSLYVDGNMWSNLAASITANVWQHVVVTGDGTDYQIYVDGVAIAGWFPVGAYADPPAETADMHIGTNSTHAGNEFRGQIADVRVYYNRALDEEEVQRVFCEGGPVKTDVNCTNIYCANDITMAFGGKILSGNLAIRSDSIITTSNTMDIGAASYVEMPQDLMVGAAGPPSYTLHVSGTLGATTSVTAGTGANTVVASVTGITMAGTAMAYRDINIAGYLLTRPTSSAPGIVSFIDENGDDTTIETYGFAVDEKVHGGFELQHDYAEGTDLVFHVHWQGIAAPSGTDNVQWRLNYILLRYGTTLNAAVAIDTADTAIDTQYKSYRSDFAAITGTSFKIGDQFMFTLTRVSATGDAYAGEALIETAGIHYQANTIGSRTITAK